MTDALTTQLETVATEIDATDTDGQTVVDFDVDLAAEHDAGHEVQSRVVVEDGTIVDGTVRFGEAPLDEDAFVDVGFWNDVFAGLVADVADGRYRARLSDFGRPVPHLCISEMDVETFAAALGDLVETLSTWYDLRGEELGATMEAAL